MIVRESSVHLLDKVSIPVFDSIAYIKMLCHKVEYIFVSLLYSAITVLKEYKLRSRGQVTCLVTIIIRFPDLRSSLVFYNSKTSYLQLYLQIIWCDLSIQHLAYMF
jgi:hypothetical protein